MQSVAVGADGEQWHTRADPVRFGQAVDRNILLVHKDVEIRIAY